MQRVTITLDDDLMEDLDRIIAVRGYQNRSEAIRDLARSGLEQAAIEVAGSRHCVAALVYVYDHHARDLPKRLTREFHHHHDLSQATLHVHLDETSCMEVTVLKGRGAEVQSFANHVIAERGVRHGHVVYVPASESMAHSPAHSHDLHHTHSHEHARHRPQRRRKRTG
ncbi:MAG TPA: nickel-responsive transcriptional regulator NikR [Xanthobacteraceae bacterium]|nr:nickel-responsive transcriptional regulator NikR [Xanthobacteraceae bacterium]